MRIIAARAYHSVHYDQVWVTLRDDVPTMARAIHHLQQTLA